jgi:hypothetical protein
MHQQDRMTTGRKVSHKSTQHTDKYNKHTNTYSKYCKYFTKNKGFTQSIHMLC